MPRQFFVGGNFKMNGNIDTIKSIVSHLNDAKCDSNTEVVIAPPALYLLLTREHLRSGIEVAAQNVFDKPNGAFTGEISVAQLKDSNITWTLLGHSERRVILQESDSFVAQKTKAALDGGIGVILCCGETLEQREAGKTIEVVTAQLGAVAREIKDWSKVVIAYEPIWAIGTGKVASTEQAQEVHASIREWLGKEVGGEAKEATRIIYGGSVSEKNCRELAKEKDIDGFLVGGASLKPAFVDIINARQSSVATSSLRSFGAMSSPPSFDTLKGRQQPLADESAAQVPTVDTVTPPHNWIRIRIHNKDDHQHIYELLEASYSHPQALNSVKEAIIKLAQVREGSFFPTHNEHSKPYEDREKARTISPTHPLHRTIKVLDPKVDKVGDEDRYVKHLTWNEPGLRAEREAHLTADPERWHVASYVSLQGALFAHHAAPLLLMLCENIESLTYSASPYSYMPDDGGEYTQHILLRTLLRNNNGQLPDKHLQRLRHVRILPEHDLWYDDDRTYSHMDVLGQVRLFHRLPGIESIAMDGIEIHGGADYQEFMPPATSNIRTIRIGHSMLASDILASLIRMPKQLEEFAYSVGGRDTRDGGHDMFSARTIGKALGDQRESLRVLDIDADDQLTDDRHDIESHEEFLEQRKDYIDDPYWYDEWFKLDEEASTGPLHVHDLPDTRVYDNTIGSLHDFAKLSELSIGVKLLLGPPESSTPFRLVDALPQSLEYLLIRGYTRGKVAKYDEAIDELIALRAERLPVLREIQGVEESIPSTEIEATRRRWSPVRYGEGEEEEADYWKLEEGDQSWA
ncbi:triosephosphate isomerase [Elasticomyces elasticus]|nr:triosephosphate isomerase [Elasticomyces elasticus]KAK4907916.1 triosephosphate isomerase [Elasticomyces elasticus]KAK5748044.1 triosephosphate isomerase [Elasticomyces elasticus]